MIKVRGGALISVHITKAGRFVGLADCYAVIALANNATFLLAVNRMVAFHTQAPNRSHYNVGIISHLAQPVEYLPHNS